MAARVAACFLFAVCLFAQSSRIDSLYASAQASEQAGDLASAAAAYEQIVQLAPHLAEAYNNLGAVRFKQGQFGAASAALEHALKLNAKLIPANALLGMTYVQMGEYAKARPRLEVVVAANPSDGNAGFLLANTLLKLGDFQAAANELQKLSKLDPSNQQVWYLLGRVHMQLAEEALGKLNAIDPNSVWAHEVSAEMMESMKNYDGAIVEWKKAVETAPNQPGVHFKLGDLYWSLSQWDNATAEFEAEARIDPRNCMVDWKLGDILVQKSVEPEQALAHIDKALAACPNLMEARADRGRVLLRLKRAQDALPDLSAAERATPSDPGVHFLLAQAYREVGDSQRAQSEMATFRDLDAKARAAQAEQAQEAITDQQKAH